MDSRSPDFDAVASDYLAAKFQTSDLLFAWLLDLSRTRFRKCAVELGCGGGELAAAAAQHFDKVVGLDLSKHLIVTAKKKFGTSNIEWAVADVMQCAPYYQTDWIFSYEAFHLLPRSPHVLHRFCDWLAPDGALTIAWCTHYWEEYLAEPISRVFGRFNIRWNPYDFSSCDHLLAFHDRHARYQMEKFQMRQSVDVSVRQVARYLGAISVASSLSPHQREELISELIRVLSGCWEPAAKIGFDVQNAIVVRRRA